MVSKKTTIWISVELRERLKQLGKKGETYEDIIRRLLDTYEKTQEPVCGSKESGAII